MPTSDKPPATASEQTDSSLRAERQKTDDELAGTGSQAELRTHEVADLAREQADETLDAARASADARMKAAGASPEILASARAERAVEDTSLDIERRTADFLLEAERLQRQRAMSSLLQAERSETDRHLLLERALADERLARILAQLAEAVRLRDDFLALASHGLKTPLTPLALRLQSLARAAASQPESPFAQQVNSYVQTAQRQIKRFSALVGDLLDVSRITSGKLTLELESVDLGAVVNEVAAQCQAHARRSGSSLEVKAPSVIGQWDALLLEQTVGHLLENAIKYGEGGPIRIRLQATADTARLAVEDEGIGIAPEHLSRIFGRFERAVPKQNYGGLGLGLYTSRTVLEAMGGTLTVQSEPGQGSTFTIELPLSGPRT